MESLRNQYERRIRSGEDNRRELEHQISKLEQGNKKSNSDIA